MNMGSFDSFHCDGERYFMSRVQPALSIELCAMSKTKDECPKNNG